MRYWASLLIVAMPLLGQGLDLKFLDKYAEKTDRVVTVTLDENLMRLGASLLGAGGDKDARDLQDVVSGLRSITVRSFEFDKDGEVSAADVSAVTRQLTGWSQIVSVRDKKENTGVWLKVGDKSNGGLVVVTQGPRELTVVSILGSIDMEKLGKLSGKMGIPNVPNPKATPKPAPKPQQEPEELP